MITFVSADDALDLEARLTDSDRLPIDLTGCTVQLRMRNKATNALFTGTMSIDAPATGGICRYPWSSGLAPAGIYFAEVVVTLPNGRAFTSPSADPEEVRIRSRV